MDSFGYHAILITPQPTPAYTTHHIHSPVRRAECHTHHTRGAGNPQRGGIMRRYGNARSTSHGAFCFWGSSRAAPHAAAHAARAQAAPPQRRPSLEKCALVRVVTVSHRKLCPGRVCGVSQSSKAVCVIASCVPGEGGVGGWARGGERKLGQRRVKFCQFDVGPCVPFQPRGTRPQ